MTKNRKRYFNTENLDLRDPLQMQILLDQMITEGDLYISGYNESGEARYTLTLQGHRRAAEEKRRYSK